jgi:hypothetical protein
MKGRREGVKGVTVSRGPVLKRGKGNHENKRKTLSKNQKKFSYFGLKFAGLYGPETLRS